MDLDQIINHLGKYTIVEKTTVSGWNITKCSDGTVKGYKDVEMSATPAVLSSSGTLASFAYFLINPPTLPAGVAADSLVAELIQTNGWGWLIRMAGGVSSAYRFVRFSGAGTTHNIKVRWKFTGTWK